VSFQSKISLLWQSNVTADNETYLGLLINCSINFLNFFHICNFLTNFHLSSTKFHLNLTSVCRAHTWGQTKRRTVKTKRRRAFQKYTKAPQKEKLWDYWIAVTQACMSPCVPKIQRLKHLKIYRCFDANIVSLEDILNITDLSF